MKHCPGHMGMRCNCGGHTEECDFRAEDELAWFTSIWEAVAAFLLVCAFCISAVVAVSYWTGA